VRDSSADPVARRRTRRQAAQVFLRRLTAGDTTVGHRFLGKAEIRVKDFADYEKKLRANGSSSDPPSAAKESNAS